MMIAEIDELMNGRSRRWNCLSIHHSYSAFIILEYPLWHVDLNRCDALCSSGTSNIPAHLLDAERVRTRDRRLQFRLGAWEGRFDDLEI